MLFGEVSLASPSFRVSLTPVIELAGSSSWEETASYSYMSPKSYMNMSDPEEYSRGSVQFLVRNSPPLMLRGNQGGAMGLLFLLLSPEDDDASPLCCRGDEARDGMSARRVSESGLVVGVLIVVVLWVEDEDFAVEIKLFS